MSFTRLSKKFIPLGSWSPDSPEFSPGFLDQIVNVIPVFGVYRPTQKLVMVSRCEELVAGAMVGRRRRVTGIYVHRISLDLSLDVMQTDYSQAPVVDGFQAVPFNNIEGLQPYWQALRGTVGDASTTILFIPAGTLKTLFGTFEKPHRAWDAVNDLTVTYQYRIANGFTGAYEFWVEVGTVNVADPTNESLFTVLGFAHKVGTLTDTTIDGKNLIVESFPIVNALFADPGDQLRWGWRLRHIIATGATTPHGNEDALDPNQVESASTIGLPTDIFGYTTQAGSNKDTDILAAIKGLEAGVWPLPNVDRPGDDTFAVSKPLWSTTSAGGVGFWLRMPFPNFVNRTNHKILFRYSMDSLAQNVGIGLFNGKNGTLIPGAQYGTYSGSIWSTTEAFDPDAPPLVLGGPNRTIMEGRIDLTDTVIQAIGNNWDNLWILFFTWPPKPDNTTTVNFFRPEADYSESVNWQLFGPSKIGSISDNDNATGLRVPVTPVTYPLSFSVRVKRFTGPRESVRAVRVCGRFANSSGLSEFTLSLIEPLTSVFTSEVFDVAGPTFIDRKATVPLAGIHDINSDLFVQVTVLDETNYLAVAEVWVEIDTGISSRARLHGISYFSPKTGTEAAPAPIDVSFLRIDGPAADPVIQQDTLKAYLGTVEESGSPTQVGKIYELSSPAFSEWKDVSRAAHYISNKRDKSWSFCNFGEIVIATNYADPVQAKYATDTAFHDLIGFDAVHVAIPGYIGSYPRARFCATINAFLCLGNIDPLSVPGVAGPYMFWCSHYGEPQRFHIGLPEWQSSVFPLVSTPGEITGMVGGEYGLVFKENSIWRMDYVGLPQIFSPIQISGEQGTVLPRSIVKVENDVYFWGIGGIYVVRDGREVEEVAAQGSVRKFVFDFQFEQFALSSHQPSAENQASSKVVGGYDTVTGCIFWSYQSQRHPEEWFENDSVLLYSPKENRFTFLRGDKSANAVFPTDRIVGASDFFPDNDLKISGFLSLGNRQTEGNTYLSKTIYAVRTIPPEVSSFSGLPVYEQFYRSNTIAGSFFGAAVGVEIEIQKVRPIFAVEGVQHVPRYQIWIEANQSPAVGDTKGKVVTLDTGGLDEKKKSHPSDEGWIDLGTPISGEFFKFALAFGEYDQPIMKEVHGWQVLYRVAGDR